MRRNLLGALRLACLVPAVGLIGPSPACPAQDPPRPPAETPPAQAKDEPKSTPKPKSEPEPEPAPAGMPIPLPGIENAFRISPRIYSGGQPTTRESFRALKDLGVKTILTVDGAEPDVELAKAYGLRYVHIPIGYDGVPRDKALRMALAAKTLPGPIFIHCHHGKHRGPAAVAVCAAVTEGWSPAQGTAWMKRAGTSPDYPGLYESISTFKLPGATDADWKAAQAAGPLPERVAPPALIDAMVDLDTVFDRLKAAQKANFPADSSAHRDATLLREQFSELLRLPACQDPAFQKAAQVASQRAEELESSLNAGDLDSANVAMNASLKSCTRCHALFRDRKPVLNPKDERTQASGTENPK